MQMTMQMIMKKPEFRANSPLPAPIPVLGSRARRITPPVRANRALSGGGRSGGIRVHIMAPGLARSMNREAALFRRAFMISAILIGFIFSLIDNALGAESSQSKSPLSTLERQTTHRSQLAYYHSGSPLVAYGSLRQVVTSESGWYAGRVSGGALRISESLTPGRFEQKSPSIYLNTDQTTVVVWQDYREGWSKIFAQQYSASGEAIGDNVKLLERTDGHNLIEPQVIGAIGGKFYLAYRDEAAGQIRCVRYNSDLTVDLADFLISDSDGSHYAGLFSIASRFTGELAVAYEDYASDNTIRMRRFGPTGAPLDSAVTVNTDLSPASHWSPSIVYDEFGALAVAWEDYRSGASDIYLRRYDSSANSLGEELNLVDSVWRSSGQYLPSLVYSTIQGHVVAWTDTRLGWDIYLQRFSKQVGLVGGNLRVSPLEVGVVFSSVQLGVNPAGFLSAVYARFAGVGSALVQRYDASLSPIGSARTLNVLTDATPGALALALGSIGEYAISWESARDGLRDVRMTLMDASLNFSLPEELTVNDDQVGALSDQPVVTTMRGWTILTAFQDQRFDGGDIFLQASSLAEELVGSNIRLNSDTVGGLQSDPALASNDTHWLACWLDSRAIEGVIGARIFARFGTEDVSLVGPELNLSGPIMAPRSDPSVALGANDTALVCWVDYRGATPQIYGRFINSEREPFGVDFVVSTPGADIDNGNVVVTVDASGSFHVLWLDRQAAGGATIKIKSYSSAGAFQGAGNFLSNQSGVKISTFYAVTSAEGDLFVLWEGETISSSSRLFLSPLDDGGVSLGATIEIPDHLASQPSLARISIDEVGNLLLAWEDLRDGLPQVYYQVFDQTLDPQGPNQPLATIAIPPPSLIPTRAPAVVAARGRSWVSWVDARAEGMNVYLAGFVHFPTSADDEESVQPESFALRQNYPNPFNPTTTITFSLARGAYTTVTIYDITGRKVLTLLDSYLSVGEHEVFWNGQDSNNNTVASGVYLYQLKAGDLRASRKMTLLK